MNRRKLTPREKAERKRRKKEFMTIFVNGRQKRIRRPPTIDGIDAEEFILRNADPVWLHQNEMWELLGESGTAEQADGVRSAIPGARESHHVEIAEVREYFRLFDRESLLDDLLRQID